MGENGIRQESKCNFAVQYKKGVIDKWGVSAEFWEHVDMTDVHSSKQPQLQAKFLDTMGILGNLPLHNPVPPMPLM